MIAGWVEKRDVTVALSPDPNDRVPFDTFDLGSWKAVWAGTATEHQQKRFAEWIIYATRGHESSYRGPNTHDTAFFEGIRSLNVQLVIMLKAMIPEGKDGVRS